MKRSILMIAMLVSVVWLTGCTQTISQLDNNDVTTIDNKEQKKMPLAAVGAALLNQQYEEVYSQLTKDFQQQITDEQFKESVASFLKQVQTLEQISSLQVNESQIGVWMVPNGVEALQVIMNKDNQISGLLLQSLQLYPNEDEKLTTTVFSTPFSEDLTVFWGGNNELINYHYAYDNQRYAYDLIQIKEGYSYNGDAARNESYYVFGVDVLAPAAGKVVKVINGIIDNEPVGVMNEQDAAGNLVVIEHTIGEYSYLAHLKKNSIIVEEGQLVEQGQLIGQIGNSGNSSEPHLHFHVADGMDLYEARSLPLQFNNGDQPVQGMIWRGISSN